MGDSIFFFSLIVTFASPVLFGIGMRHFFFALREKETDRLDKHITGLSLSWGLLVAAALGLLLFN